MSLRIKQKDQKWTIEIEGEGWQFDNRTELETVLRTLLDIKEKNGNIGRKYE